VLTAMDPMKQRIGDWGSEGRRFESG